MPPEVIKYPYSKKSSYAGVVMLTIFIVLLLKTCISSYLIHDMLGTGLFGVLALLIFALMVLMIVTRLVPAINGEIALELDENGVKDYIRNIILDWKDIEDIGLKPGRSSAMLVFELKFDSDFGEKVLVSLRWVQGKDREIYKTVVAYFDEVEGIERVDDDEEADNEK